MASLDISAAPLLNARRAAQCPLRLQNDLLPPPDTVALPPSPAQQRRMEAGREFEKAVFDELLRLHPDAVLIGSAPDGAERTVAAMRDGIPMILGGTMPDDLAGRRVGRPDLLLRTEDGYVPGDVKHHGVLDTASGKTALVGTLADLTAYVETPDVRVRAHREHDDGLQLAHYRRMLEAGGFAGGAAWGFIVDRLTKVVRLDLDDARHRVWWAEEKVSWMQRYDHEFEFRRDVAAHTELRRDDPALAPKAVPVAVIECRTCPWQKTCHAQLVAEDHVSLLPRFTWQHFVEYRRRGVLARSELAALDPFTAQFHAALTGAMLKRVDEAEGSDFLDGLFPRPAVIADLAGEGITTAGELRARLDPATAAFRGAKIGNLLNAIDNARAATAGTPHRRRGPGTSTCRELPSRSTSTWNPPRTAAPTSGVRCRSSKGPSGLTRLPIRTPCSPTPRKRPYSSVSGAGLISSGLSRATSAATCGSTTGRQPSSRRCAGPCQERRPRAADNGHARSRDQG